jgi:hypothetical protein
MRSIDAQLSHDGSAPRRRQRVAAFMRALEMLVSDAIDARSASKMNERARIRDFVCTRCSRISRQMADR